MAPQTRPADVIFTGGAVYTMDAAGRWADAVAVTDGRIVAVGTEAEVRDHVGRRTEIVNLDGRMLLPGFQDSHVHPVGGGIELNSCNLADLHTRATYTQRIARYAAENPAAEWILGGGWSMDAFPRGLPDKEDLDTVVPDRPVYLPNRDHHSAWVNTRALQLAGLTRDTRDPVDGRIERDERGEPTGALHEGAMDLVRELIPEPSEEELRDGLLTAQSYLHSLGVTGWQDAMVGRSSVAPNALPAYRALAASGELTARVVGALWWDRHGGIEQVERLIADRAEASIGRFRATSIKIMQDGVCETFTASLLAPYLDARGEQTGNYGISFIDPEALRSYVTRLDAEGFQVHFHALGDRAVRDALDAIDVARRANGANDHRHHLAHLQVVHPDDLPRLRRLGVVANCQPLWACNEPAMTDLTAPFLGPDRAQLQYPFGSLHRYGTQIAFGSDWPVSSPNPLEEIHVAVNRTVPGSDGSDEVFIPTERLDLATALRAFTMGTAYVNHLDRETGSIEPGKYADLVVLDRNLFEVDPNDIHDAHALLTLVEGATVYESPKL